MLCQKKTYFFFVKREIPLLFFGNCERADLFFVKRDLYPPFTTLSTEEAYLIVLRNIAHLFISSFNSHCSENSVDKNGIFTLQLVSLCCPPLFLFTKVS